MIGNFTIIVSSPTLFYVASIGLWLFAPVSSYPSTAWRAQAVRGIWPLGLRLWLFIETYQMLNDGDLRSRACARSGDRHELDVMLGYAPSQSWHPTSFVAPPNLTLTNRLSKKALLSSGNRTFKVKIITKGNSGVMLRGENEEIYF